MATLGRRMQTTTGSRSLSVATNYSVGRVHHRLGLDPKLSWTEGTEQREGEKRPEKEGTEPHRITGFPTVHDNH